MSTVEQVRAQVTNTKGHLDLLQRDLQGEIEDLRARAREPGGLTAEEQARLDERRAQRMEAGVAFRDLTFVALSKLDNSQEVANMIAKMRRVNQDLKDDIERLRHIARYADTAAQIAAGISTITATLATFA